MNIVACIKRVPATDTRVKLNPDGTFIDTSEVEWVINPYDEYAVEAALQVKEATGSGEVIVVTLGPAEATKELRTCLAMGADRAILLKDGDWLLRDAQTTAAVLAEAIGETHPDLVLCGKQAVDRDQGQVGTLLACHLGLPVVTEIRALDVSDGTARCERAGDEGTSEKYDVSLPAVLTCTKGLNEPRYASLKGIMAAKRKPVDERDATVADNRLAIHKIELPPARQAGKIVGEGPEAVEPLVRLLREEAKVF